MHRRVHGSLILLEGMAGEHGYNQQLCPNFLSCRVMKMNIGI